MRKLFLLLSLFLCLLEGKSQIVLGCNGPATVKLTFDCTNLPLNSEGNICAKVTLQPEGKYDPDVNYSTPVVKFFTAFAKKGDLKTYAATTALHFLAQGKTQRFNVIVEPIFEGCNNNSFQIYQFNPIARAVTFKCDGASIGQINLNIPVFEQRQRILPCDIRRPLNVQFANDVSINPAFLKFGFYNQDSLIRGKTTVPPSGPGTSDVYLIPIASDGENAAGRAPAMGLITEIRWSSHTLTGNTISAIRIEVDGNMILFELSRNNASVFKDGDYYRLPLGEGIRFCRSMFISVATFRPRNLPSATGTAQIDNAFAAWRTIRP